MSDKGARSGRGRSARDLNLDLPGEGTGLAESVRRLILGRRRSVDAAVEAATSGRSEARRLRRMRDGQSTDNSQ